MLSRLTDKQKIIGEIISIAVLIGFLIPKLISAKDTSLVVLGLAFIGLVVAYFTNQLPVKSMLATKVFGK